MEEEDLEEVADEILATEMTQQVFLRPVALEILVVLEEKMTNQIKVIPETQLVLETQDSALTVTLIKVPNFREAEIILIIPLDIGTLMLLTTTMTIVAPELLDSVVGGVSTGKKQVSVAMIDIMIFVRVEGEMKIRLIEVILIILVYNILTIIKMLT